MTNNTVDRPTAGASSSKEAPLRRIVVDATACLSGGKVYVNELLPALIESLDHTEWIIFGEPTPELEAVAAHSHVKFHRVHFPQPTRSLLRAGVAKLLWRELVLPFRLALSRPCLLLTTANFASPILSLLKVPVVLAIHNLLPFHEPQWYREPTFVRRLRQSCLRSLTVESARRVERTIAFSAYAKDVLEERGISSRKISIVHHGISPARQKWEGADSDTVLLVSHYFAYKNIDIPIRALPRVHTATGRPIKLVVQGIPYDPVCYARLQDLVHKLGLEEFVVLGTGVASSELAPLYASSRCLVFPSIGENCPITLLEAMSVGIPIVGAQCQPVPELCGDAALYYDTYDEESCAEAIIRLFASEGTAQELSKSSRRRANSSFTWGKCAVHTAEALRLAWAPR